MLDGDDGLLRVRLSLHDRLTVLALGRNDPPFPVAGVTDAYRHLSQACLAQQNRHNERYGGEHCEWSQDRVGHRSDRSTDMSFGAAASGGRILRGASAQAVVRAGLIWRDSLVARGF